MHQRTLVPLLLIGLVAAVALRARIRPDDSQATAPHYVFSYFTGNGENGVHLAHSRDGMTWQALNGGASLPAPAVGEVRLMRDPCRLRSPSRSRTC